ncbi:histone acetyltransferase p300-like [Sycon ciliatum]|uniref:histone acetyltransferase p300-like n=1 Tax=Sycon ciliatum TaxID=27933 RepID=UPI0031F65254
MANWPKLTAGQSLPQAKQKNCKKGCSQPQYGRKKKSKPAPARKRKDFAARVLTLLEEDKSAFFTITLISSEKVANLKPMQEDVAEQQSSNVMESRDSILAYFRKNHLEFTTLWHAQYATLCMLIELQSQCNENVIGYRCNTCMAEIIGSRFHCPECKDFDLVLSAIRNAAMITRWSNMVGGD